MAEVAIVKPAVRTARAKPVDVVIARISDGERALAEARTVADVVRVAKAAEAIRQWARLAEVGVLAENAATELRLRAERRAGELLKATDKNKGAQGVGKALQKVQSHSGTALPATLSELGVTKKQSSTFQQVADVPKPVFEKYVASQERTSRNGLIKQTKRATREHRVRTRTAKMEKKARESGLSAVLAVADLREWRPQAQAIITDPPYIGDSIPLYEALRDFSVDVLPDGGPLVVMTWQAILPEVVRALEHKRLVYRWAICWRYTNTENTVDHARKVFDCWKPVLVYHAGGMPKDAKNFRDEIASEAPAKDHHEWGQSLEGFERLVKAFTQPGETVCDPFLGGGTTAIAAKAQARNFVGCDIDPKAVDVARGRIA